MLGCLCIINGVSMRQTAIKFSPSFIATQMNLIGKDANISQVKSAFSQLYKMNTISSNSGVLSESQICSIIDSGHPIYARMSYRGIGSNHAVVISGYYVDGSNASISYMEPNYGSIAQGIFTNGHFWLSNGDYAQEGYIRSR